MMSPAGTIERPEATIRVGNETARVAVELFDKSVSDDEVRRLCNDAIEQMLRQKRALQ